MRSIARLNSTNRTPRRGNLSTSLAATDGNPCALSWGTLRYDPNQHGYGGPKVPLFASDLTSKDAPAGDETAWRPCFLG